MKLTKAQVQKFIYQQTINNQKIYYSYAGKHQATLSMLKNQRLLLFNSKSGLLYYINEPSSLPFITQIPKPKNECANINISICKNPPGTCDLNVQFGMKNPKGEMSSIQWNFTFDNKQLAATWISVIQQYKAKKIQQAASQQNKIELKPEQKKINSSQQVAENAFVHDTLGYGMLEIPKNPPSKTPRNQNAKADKQPSVLIEKSKNNQQKLPIKPTESTLNSQAQKVPLNVQKSPVGSLHNSQISQIVEANKKNQPSDQKEPKSPQRTPKPQIQNSNFVNPQESKQILNEKDSLLTFKDKLSTVISQNHRLTKPINQNSDQTQKPQNDWNLKFLRQQSEQVILDFKHYAVEQFLQLLQQDQKSTQKLRIYLKESTIVLVANARTAEAKKMKSEFRNYHFIVESCKDNFIVGVPLACLIEFKGLVSLVKGLIPSDAPKVQLTQETASDLKELERYTRIKNNVLKKATLYDLSHIYGFTDRRLIYLNSLFEYLPVHMEEVFRGRCLRPEHILDNLNQFIPGGEAFEANRLDLKVLADTFENIKKNAVIFSKQLSSSEICFANCSELKQIMHERGLNLRCLTVIYEETTNKMVKKYLHTFMVAKIAKMNVLENLIQIRNQQSSSQIKSIVQKSIKLFMEGNSNISNELWKQIALTFRKQYNLSMSNHDILGSFFLNCLMELIPGTYDLSKINQQKTFFKDQNIISNGFLIKLAPKVRSFGRFSSKNTEKLMEICKGEADYGSFASIVEQLQLQKKTIPRYLQLSRTDQTLKMYMTYFAPPSELQPAEYPHLSLYQELNASPPTSKSLKITQNYLKWCLQYQKYAEFKSILEQTLRSIAYWLDPGHVFHCDFFQILSQYYEQVGAVDDSINFMKESLAVCVRNGGTSSRKTGEKYFSLGQKELKAGRVGDSMENFLKAKSCMESHKASQNHKYPLTLLKIASLYLAENKFSSSVQLCKQAVEKFEQFEKNQDANSPKGIYDQHSIKAIDIMSRCFEIEGKKNELYKMAQLASTKYNKTTNKNVYSLLMKLCLTATVAKNSMQKSQIFQSLLEKLFSPSQTSQIKDQNFCLSELMNLSTQFNVMQKFMTKFESLEKLVLDFNGRKQLNRDSMQFLTITKLIVGLVGQDYVYGLIQQKQFDSV